MREITPKPGDVVIVHAMRIGKVVDKFLSAAGKEILGVKLAGSHRVAALACDGVINLGPWPSEETTLSIGTWREPIDE